MYTEQNARLFETVKAALPELNVELEYALGEDHTAIYVKLCDKRAMIAPIEKFRITSRFEVEQKLSGHYAVYGYTVASLLLRAALRNYGASCELRRENDEILSQLRSGVMNLEACIPNLLVAVDALKGRVNQ